MTAEHGAAPIAPEAGPTLQRRSLLESVGLGAQNWYVAQLKPNGLALALRHLSRQGFRGFAPRLAVAGGQKGKTATAPRPVFPGYVFVQFVPEQQRWQAINATRGIARLIVGDPRRPLPLPSSFMAGLMARCDASGVIARPGDLCEGDRIRILSGPFADFITVVDRLDEGDCLSVLIEVMGRPVRTRLPRQIVEKLHAAGADT
ncbi:transcription termination/antitermination protein NusG [Pseudodonghicola flavimaris]|uniref:Transcription termination/antitermination NusG family protein n=1 Tax=Pseudodonghicola flavimaris TaxID=3050036 RepID=A0ABT7EZS4_9RHOB|nr:transcription termination/antitermination NusG family protein [Pseudodonghicola flavimaris]MDK3017750.1 transcription termination/antitermination NusG family protein [Pseudodonghicola flavimaris]